MLWYKAWLETRWRFVIGLAIVTCSAAGIVFAYPKVLELMPLVPAIDAGGEIGRRIREAVELAREYRGYVWSQGFRQNLTEMITLFAVLLGTGGLLTQATGGAALFTLSMPASRKRLMSVRAAAGLGELLALAMVPAVLIPIFSPAIGQSYGVRPALVHGTCLFIASATFFSLAFLLSTVFNDVWRPMLIALAVAIGVALAGHVFHDVSRYGIYGVMSGEVYFRTGRLPWGGLLASAALSAAMLYAATVNFVRWDF